MPQAAAAATLNLSQARQTITAKASTTVIGKLSLTQTPQGFEFTGKLNATQGANTLTGKGGPVAAGSLNQTQGPNTLVAQGGFAASATLALTEGANTITAAGGPVVAGSMNVSQGGQFPVTPSPGEAAAAAVDVVRVRRRRRASRVYRLNLHVIGRRSRQAGDRVMRQAKARIFRGETRSEGKIVSLFEPSTEVIRKGKAAKPTEFGKLVKLQEAENQIIIEYEVYAQRPNDSDLLMPAIEVHAAKLGRVPRLVAADAGFYSAKNEAAAKAKGVKRVCIPNRGSKSAARKREHKKRWFRDGQRWRTGCEGRISVSKRRHGLQRCRYRGDDGMRRWVGLGVIADNLINIGRAIAAHPAT